MNPWGNSKIGPKDLNDYLELAQIDKIESPSPVCELHRQILKLIEDYYKLSSILKEDSDLSKVGEFIQPSQLQSKKEKLEALSTLFHKINENLHIFIQKSKETRPGNQLFINQEYHKDFFRILSLTKQTDLLDIASHTGKIHERTKKNLSDSLSASLSQESDLIVSSVISSCNKIQKINDKYLKKD